MLSPYKYKYLEIISFKYIRNNSICQPVFYSLKLELFSTLKNNKKAQEKLGLFY